jgi:uncharacterized protein (DUF2141 family)
MHGTERRTTQRRRVAGGWYILLVLSAVLGANRLTAAPPPVARSAPSAPQPTITLTVVLEGGEGPAGQWGVSLFTAAPGFPQEHERAAHARLLPRTAGRDSAVFRDLPPGRYAVSAFHDANGNRVFDTNRLGMPREAWAVSGSVRPRLRAPRFDEAILEITSDTRVVLRLER